MLNLNIFALNWFINTVFTESCELFIYCIIIAKYFFSQPTYKQTHTHVRDKAKKYQPKIVL